MISEKTREYNRLWELEHRQKRTKYRKTYNYLNKERISELRKIRYQKDIAHQRKMNQVRNRKYYAKHKKRRFQYHYDRIANDDLYRFKVRLRSRLYKFLRLKGFQKQCTFNEYVGCTPKELRERIEKKFEKGMTWANYGRWHIDHIKPISLAKTEKGAYKLMHFSNLQPMWWIDNIRKGNKITSQI